MTSDAQVAQAGVARLRMPPFVRELLLFLLLMVAYEFVRDVVEPSTPDAALEHARQIVDAERAVGLFVEPDVQRVVHDVPGGEFLTKWFYTLAHTVGFTAFFLWVWLRHRSRFPFVRTWFWLTNGVALLGYWLYPLAPPRLVPGLGMEDSTAEALTLGGSLDWFQPFRNVVAAMPSMHVGYTVLFTTAVILMGVSRRRWLWLLYPAFMLLTVMATANHYWLDGVGGAAAVAAGLILALVVAPRARRPWQRPQTAPPGQEAPA